MVTSNVGQTIKNVDEQALLTPVTLLAWRALKSFLSRRLTFDFQPHGLSPAGNARLDELKKIKLTDTLP